MKMPGAKSMSCADQLVSCNAPVLAVCGFSGSGKTTLLEVAIPNLIAGGLSVAVVKHDSHGVLVDVPGKDSDRLFRAGATVVLRGPEEQFQRRRGRSAVSLSAALADLGQDHDLVLVEGHKDTPLPKFWLEDTARNATPRGVTNVVASLAWDSDRSLMFLEYINKWLPEVWRARPVRLGLLFDDPRAAVETPDERHHVERGQPGKVTAQCLEQRIARDQATALGTGPMPQVLAGLSRLPDAPGLKGPYASLLTAHRWDPSAAWIVASYRNFHLCFQDVESLKALRCPGRWAVVVLQHHADEFPTLVLYEPQALVALERKILEEPDWNKPVPTLFDHYRTLTAGPRTLKGNT